MKFHAPVHKIRYETFTNASKNIFFKRANSPKNVEIERNVVEALNSFSFRTKRAIDYSKTLFSNVASSTEY